MTGSVESTEIASNLNHPIGETPFVVVPGEDADKPLVEDLGLRDVKGRALRVVVEIDRDGRRFVDAENAAQPARARRLLHQGIDLVARSIARRVEFEVD